MDPGIGHQICLELVQIHIQGTIKPERGGDGRDDLSNQPVEVGIGWSLVLIVPCADVKNGLKFDRITVLYVTVAA